jgi:hypothetical protein
LFTAYPNIASKAEAYLAANTFKAQTLELICRNISNEEKNVFITFSPVRRPLLPQMALLTNCAPPVLATPGMTIQSKPTVPVPLDP